jgi:hypothetical protein
MKATINRTIATALIGMLASVLTGCASQTELPPQMTQDLVTMRDQLVQGKAQVQTTCNAARDLTQRPQAQIQPQVDHLVKQIDALEDLATNHRKNFASADERAQTYFSHWDQEMQGMSKSLAQQGEARRVQSQKSFEELKTRVGVLREQFRPFMGSLTEVSKYLKTDTTAAGVKAVTPQIKSALDDENKIMQKADAVIAQIDAMRGGK